MVQQFGETLLGSAHALCDRNAGVVPGKDDDAAKQVFDPNVGTLPDEHLGSAHSGRLPADRKSVVERESALADRVE